MVDIISPVEKERNGATWVLIPDVRECNMTKTSDVYTTIRQDARGLLARAGDDLHARTLWADVIDRCQARDYSYAVKALEELEIYVLYGKDAESPCDICHSYGCEAENHL